MPKKLRRLGLSCLALLLLPACAAPTPRPQAAPVRRLHTIHIKSHAEMQAYFRYDPHKPILISAHRGGMLPGYPENCIESFEKTLTMMPSLFEIDPRLTKDGVLVLMHDDTLDRTTTGTGNVSDHTLAELRQLYLKDRQGNVTPYRIPTLKEALEWGKDTAVFNFDNKHVPWQMYSDLLKTEWAQYPNIMLSVRSLKEAMFYFERNENVMICPEISDMAKYKAYERSGIPWNRIMAFVRFKIESQHQPVYDLLHSHGVMTMISICPTTDRIKDDAERIAAYRKEVASNPDIIETDYPSQFVGLPLSR
jgi:glycerophosphoryl diester phosphodiesterase